MLLQRLIIYFFKESLVQFSGPHYLCSSTLCLPLGPRLLNAETVCRFIARLSILPILVYFLSSTTGIIIQAWLCTHTVNIFIPRIADHAYLCNLKFMYILGFFTYACWP